MYDASSNAAARTTPSNTARRNLCAKPSRTARDSAFIAAAEGPARRAPASESSAAAARELGELWGGVSHGPCGGDAGVFAPSAR